MKTALACLAAASALALMPADAAPKPKWEVGVGAFATYSPAYWGASRDSDDFGGFPVVYFIYRGEDISIFSNGLFDVDSNNTERFTFGVSVDGSGGVDSEDRHGLGDIDPVLEIGPKITFALFATGTQRLEASLAARVAYQWGEGFEGWVFEPSLAYLVSLNDTTRLGFTLVSKFGSEDYNDLWYTDGFYVADSGYIGSSLSINLVHDLSDKLRMSAQAKIMTIEGSDMDKFASLVEEDTNYSFRIGFTYSIWQSSEMARE